MKVRIAAGILVLTALVLFSAVLVPVYYHNWQLQNYLEDAASRDANLALPADVIRVSVAGQAARLGLPVRPEQVSVLQGSGQVKIGVSYAVRIDLALYTVDLHFHPGASR